MKNNIINTIFICLLFFISISIKAQTSEVYWDQVINSKLISSTSFESTDKYTLSAGYSINELSPNEDGGVEASLQSLGKNAILVLTRKQDSKVVIESDKYFFKKNLDYYIQATPTGYEINEKLIPSQVSEKDIIKIMRLGNTIYFLVNGKTIQEVEATDSHLFPLVAVAIVTEKASNVTFFNKNSEELLVKSTITSASTNVMGTLDIEVFGGQAPYIYSWEHTEENTSSLKGLNIGTYKVSITDAQGKSITKSYQIDTEVFFGKSNSSSTHFNTSSQPLSLISGEYIAKDQEGKMYWSEAAVRGNIYIGFTTTKELNNDLKNDLLYSFLLNEEQVHISFEGKIIYSSTRTKNLNTLYSIIKEDGNIVFSINGKNIIKQKYTEDISLSPKVLLLNKSELGTIKGDFTGTNKISLTNNFPENQVKTTAYFKQQQLVWLGSNNIQIAENELPALQDGWIKWYGKSTDVWFESSDKKVFQFDNKLEKVEKNNYRIQRDKNVISFYENDIFQNALSTDPNQNLVVKTSNSEQTKAEASFGRCGSGGGPTNKWYFGHNSGISFETNPPSALIGGMTKTDEGTGVISDENGHVLFYTDGHNVFTKNHTVMTNGDALLGDISATQKGLIVPDPKVYANGEKRYYIFYSTEIDTYTLSTPITMYYAIVKFTSPTDLGEVIEKNKLLHASNSWLDERVTAVKHATLNAYWIIVRKHHTTPNQYMSYLLTEDGLVDATTTLPVPPGSPAVPIISEVGLGDADLATSTTATKGFIGQIKLSPNSKWLAVANVRRSGYSSVQVFPFDAQTGQIGQAKFTALAGAGLFQNVYGIEFSPDGRYLYAADMYCGNAKIFKYDLNTVDNTSFLTSRITLPDNAYNALDANGNIIYPNIAPFDCIGALQLGPDGKIYVSRYFGEEQVTRGLLPSEIAVGRIDPNTDVYDKLAVPMPQTGMDRFPRYGLPGFVQSFLPCAEFYFGDDIVATGQTSVTISFPSNFPATPTSYLWSTGETTPTITVTTSGTYTLTIKYGDPVCGTECIVSDEIEVTFQNGSSPCVAPLQITDIFSCDTYILTAQDGFTNYQWNTGESGRTLIVHSDGEYSVTAFDAVNNCIRKGVFYASSNDLCYEEKPAVTTTTTSFNEVLSVSVVNYSDSWLKLVKPNSNQNPFLNAQKGVWRADASFAYMQNRSAVEETGAADVDLSKDGTFNLQMLNWGYHGNLYSENWRKVATLEQYNAEGFEVENRDILGRYSSALYGYHNQLSTAVATNARYSEIAYEGFEEYNTSKIKSIDLTTSNFDFLTFSDDESSSASIYSYRHHNIVWAQNNTATVEVNTGRPFLSTTATLKVVPISTQLTQVLENIPVTLTPHTSRTWKATLSTSNLPAKWKGSIALSTTHKVVPLFDINETKIEVAQDYGHTGKKSLSVTGNAGFEQVRFDPLPGRSYIISLWVSVKEADVPTFTSDTGLPEEAKRGVKVKFEGSTEEFFFEPTGRIIEGWQRIEGTFCVPQRYDKLSITLQSGRNETTYFDDLRLHPFDGNIQTYVYDPNNYLLRAVLDRNNFATFYYYDAEQQLRLVKKETERGVKTIQEVGNNMPSTK